MCVKFVYKFVYISNYSQCNKNNNNTCSDLSDKNILVISVDGYFGGWSNWTDCSKTCENGTQQRTRLCIFDKLAPHGNNCSGVDTDTQTCNPQLCPGMLQMFVFMFILWLSKTYARLFSLFCLINYRKCFLKVLVSGGSCSFIGRSMVPFARGTINKL